MFDDDLVSIGLRREIVSFDYRTPMKFGGRVVNDVTIANVLCSVVNHRGAKGEGIGSMTMGVAWAWPSRSLDASQTLRIVLELQGRLLASLSRSDGFAEELLKIYRHPFDLCLNLHPLVATLATAIENEFELDEPIPALARLLAASPVQAAIFDAYGKAANRNCFEMLGPEFLDGDLATYLGNEFVGKTLDQFVLPAGMDSMPLYHLVGALDPIFEDDVQKFIGDGLPETLAGWIARDGLTHLKIKLDGADRQWDYHRIAAVNRCADQAENSTERDWQFSLDFNERCQSEEYVLRLLDELQSKLPGALKRIQYIEQPTHRDLRLHPENTMHNVAARMPVVIDESLVDYESLLLAKEQGYSGVAIKACKGHADALLMAAAAQHHNMFLCVQDLTCVGISFLHSAALTAHLPGAKAIEGNGRQYCPAANKGWEDRFPGMFDVREGRVPTRLLSGPGLGY